MSTTVWLWVAVAALALWVLLCHINILVLSKWVKGVGGGPADKHHHQWGPWQQWGLISQQRQCESCGRLQLENQ